MGSLGPLTTEVADAQDRLAAAQVVERIWQRDHTVWPGGPDEVSDRLGWLDVAGTMRKHLSRVAGLVEAARAAGYRRAVILGMGGSSLAPEVCARVFGARPGHLHLVVLDSTSPRAVAEIGAGSAMDETLFVVATKSGGTVETLSFAKYFHALGRAGEQFVAITDPGSGLADLASQLQFRETFLNDPEIGGRYSALSLFGLVPAALLGVSPAELLDGAAAAAAGNQGGESVAAQLGAALGAAATAGRDKLMLVASPEAAPLIPWVEQLVAESTGKHGRGILPVEQPLDTALQLAVGGSDRLYVTLDAAASAVVPGLVRLGQPVVALGEQLGDVQQPGGIAGHFFVWELAVAVAGHLLGINPFDQPDVEAAKVLAREAVEAYRETGVLGDLAPTGTDELGAVHGGAPGVAPMAAVHRLLQGEADDGRYLAIQAFVAPAAQITQALADLAQAVTATLGIVATYGYGPRFLHSTGQLHKGGGGSGLFLQVTEGVEQDVVIPDEPGEPAGALTFGILLEAQVRGDGEALRGAGRELLRLHVTGDPAGAIRQLAVAIRAG